MFDTYNFYILNFIASELCVLHLIKELSKLFFIISPIFIKFKSKVPFLHLQININESFSGRSNKNFFKI